MFLPSDIAGRKEVTKEVKKVCVCQRVSAVNKRRDVVWKPFKCER